MPFLLHGTVICIFTVQTSTYPMKEKEEDENEEEEDYNVGQCQT